MDDVQWTARDLDNALYAALLSRAHSDQARQLVQTIALKVASHEVAVGARANKRITSSKTLDSTIERFLGDLLRAHTVEKTKGFIFRSMRPEAFTGGEVGFRTFTRVVASLTDLALIESFRGFQAMHDPSIRKSTRFRATQRLLDLCSDHGLAVAEFHQHFFAPLPEHPLQLRAASQRSSYGDKVRGRPIKFEVTPATERLESEVKALNAFFEEFDLRGGTHRGYLRVFNNGDDPKFKWNMGGRLYSYGEGNYQQIDGADRLRMTINGDPVCEIDIRASYLTIFHALHGKQLDPARDPYDIPGLGLEARDVVKMWVTATFGNNAPITKWPRDLVADYKERTGHKLGKRYAASKVAESVLQQFPLLAQLVDKPENGWAKLMYIEAQAMTDTLLELMHERIPSLAVHDSLIVPGLLWPKGKAVLTKHYRHYAKATPVLKIKFPEGYDENSWNL